MNWQQEIMRPDVLGMWMIMLGVGGFGLVAAILVYFQDREEAAHKIQQGLHKPA